MKNICFALFLIGNIIFSQNLEEAIYSATETFIANQNETSLNQLNQQETLFKNQISNNDEQLALVFLLCNKAYYLNNKGYLKQAISTYEEASNVFIKNNLSKLSDFDITEHCLKPLGNLYTKTGDYTNAESTIMQYIYLAENNNNINQQVSGAINRSKLYFTIGKYESVIKIINDALKLPQITNSQIKALQNFKTSSLIALNKIEDASFINESVITSNYIKNKNTYAIALQKGNYTKALKAFNNAKAYLNEAQLDNRGLSKFYFEEAQLHYTLKNKNEAKYAVKRALTYLLPNFNENSLISIEDLYPENTFIDIFDLFAALEDHSKTALYYFDLAFHVSSLLRNNWTSQENKLQNQAADRLRSEKCIDLLFNDYLKTNNNNLLIKAFQYAEDNKASVLKEIYQIKTRLSKFPTDPLLQKEFELLKEQERITNLLIKAQLQVAEASKINTLSQTLNSVSVNLKTIRKEVFKKYGLTNKNTISIEILQEKLKTDHAKLVEYFYGKNTIYQFIISENTITLKDIPVDGIFNETITNFIHLFNNSTIINNDIVSFTNQAHNLYKILNLEALKNTKNLILVPDGLLNFIPFDALLSKRTNTIQFAKMPFLLKTHNLAYNSSSYFYLTTNSFNKSKKLLGVFPVFENSPQALNFSINEAEAIKKEVPGELLLTEKATKNNFLKKASYYDILHLSTHANSGDFVTPAHIEFYDKTLYLNELYSLSLNNRLVVLSACETGIGKLYKGEGAMSLARGFQYAGAKNILFSLWQINDLSTSQIMASFYKYFTNSESAFIANRKSKLSYLENINISNIKKSPYYWSAFTYYGSLEPEKSSNILFYFIIGILITFLAVFLLLKLKKPWQKHFSNFFLKKDIRKQN